MNDASYNISLFRDKLSRLKLLAQNLSLLNTGIGNTLFCPCSCNCSNGTILKPVSIIGKRKGTHLSCLSVIITCTKDGLFYPPCVCLFVCLSVCLLAISYKSYSSDWKLVDWLIWDYSFIHSLILFARRKYTQFTNLNARQELDFTAFSAQTGYIVLSSWKLARYVSLDKE